MERPRRLEPTRSAPILAVAVAEADCSGRSSFPHAETDVTRDRSELRAWYCNAMLKRIDELRALLPGLEAGDAGACDAARTIAQALRGS